MLVHPHGLGRLNILGESVGRHGDNGDLLAVIPVHGPDGSGGVVAVHPRHLDVHEDDVVISVLTAEHPVHSFRSVGSALHSEAGHLQDLPGDLRVQLIVLHKQGTATRQIYLSKLCKRRNRFLLLFAYQGAEGPGQPGAEQRLADEGVGTGRPGLLLNVRPVIGRNDDDRYIPAHRLPDRPCGGDPVHIRHLPVDDAGKVVPPLLVVEHHLFHGLRTAGNPLGLHAQVIQHPAAGLQTDIVVIRHQHVQIHKLIIPDLRGVLELQIHGDREAGADAQGAFDLDVAAHHADDIPADGHPQAGALDLVHPAVRSSGKGLKDLVDKFLAHADAVVLKDKFIAPDLRLVGGFF